MPLLQNKYQPLFPDPNSPSNYNCGDEQYCHLLAAGDPIKTQFYQTPCAASEIEDPEFSEITLGTEVLTNGSFTGNANDWITAGGVLPSNGWAYDSNNIRHTPGTQLAVYQTALATALVTGYYQIVIDITRTSGSVRVRMGNGGTQTVTDYYDTTGTYTISVLFTDILDQIVAIEPNPTDDFDGTINSISIKEITYSKWTPTPGWLLSDGYACHSTGYTGTLEESVADYIVADEYYELNLTVTGYISGTCGVYVANVLVGTLSENGTVHLYGTPTATGVVSFVPSSNFIGCINFLDFGSDDYLPGLFELKNNHLAYLVDPDGVTEYQIGEYFNYYERYVTLIFDIALLELPYDCYTIKVVDACVVTGANLVTNGDFTEGSADWTQNNGNGQYDYSGGELQLIYEPNEGSNYITNGDFAAGFTGWTAGAGWSMVSNKARHTAGSTAQLVQSVVIPAPTLPPTVYTYHVRFRISNRTAGSVTIGLGDRSAAGYSNNDLIALALRPTTSGAVDFYITPTSNFDGDIDDIEVYYNNNVWSSAPILTNVANTDMLAGNYELSFEITAQSDSRISAGVEILGQTQSITYFDTVGVHTVQIPNYIPGAQQVRIIGKMNINGYNIWGTINIDNVQAYPIEPFEATYTSECIKYGASFNNSKMMVGYCDQPAFGFEFANTGFQFQQRAVIRSIAPNYPTTSTLQKSGTGNARLTYAEVEKFWELHTAFASETFHDAMAVMVRCDHFLIGPAADNGTEYIVNPDDYTPEWLAGGVYALAPAVMIVRIKDGGQVFNRHL